MKGTSSYQHWQPDDSQHNFGDLNSYDFYFLAEVPLIPLLHIPMDLFFPLFHREFSYFESCVFQT